MAIFIFALGGGLAIYEGIDHLRHPIHNLADTGIDYWNYGVLIGAIVFESFSFWMAYREFRKAYPTGFFSAISKSKDAATFAVMVEDTAALAGLVIALMGVTLADVTHNPVFDGAASIAIGLLLSAVALFLARETKGLLVGESAVPEEIDTVNQILSDYGQIKHYGNLRSMHLGPDNVLLAVDINFWDSTTAGEIEELVKEIEARIVAIHPHFKQIYLETIDYKPS